MARLPLNYGTNTHPPDYTYMQEIGCCAFVLILNQHNPKINAQSIECILIGYMQNSKAYRCYDPRTQKVYETYHVQFIEHHNTPPTPALIESLVPVTPTAPAMTKEQMSIIRVKETSVDTPSSTHDDDSVDPTPIPLPDNKAVLLAELPRLNMPQQSNQMPSLTIHPSLGPKLPSRNHIMPLIGFKP